MQTNRLHIEQVAGVKRTQVLDTYQCAELNVHLNSFYVQLRGALDNLAWALHYQFALLGTGDESDVATQRRCGLFARPFLKSLAVVRPALAEFLESKQDWYVAFKQLRDPVAHRVPLYAMPGVIREGSAAAKHMRQVNEEMEAAAAKGDFERVRDKFFESVTVGHYEPWFMQYSPDGYCVRDMGAQIALDGKQFLSVAQAVLQDIFSAAALRSH